METYKNNLTFMTHLQPLQHNLSMFQKLLRITPNLKLIGSLFILNQARMRLLTYYAWFMLASPSYCAYCLACSIYFVLLFINFILLMPSEVKNRYLRFFSFFLSLSFCLCLVSQPQLLSLGTIHPLRKDHILASKPTVFKPSLR